MKNLYRKAFEWVLWKCYTDEAQDRYQEQIEGHIGPMELLSAWSLVLDAWVCVARIGNLHIAVRGGSDLCYEGGIFLVKEYVA